VHHAEPGDDARRPAPAPRTGRTRRAGRSRRRACRVAEPLDPLARRELPLLVLPIDLVRPAALAEPRLERADLCGELAEAVVRRARGGAPGRAGAADALTRPGPARAPRPARARRTTA
jgi:hypothetical protein